MKNEGKLRVVVVDDDPDLLRAIAMLLKAHYEVTCFSSGVDLINYLPVLEPDLIILDVNMPIVDGFTLCRKIRASQRFHATPILFLTASREDVDFVEHLHVGGDSYLNKPVNQKLLQSRIREILAN